MYQALVNKESGRVLQFVKGGTEARFEVHESLMWVEGPYEIAKGTEAPDYWYYPNDREVRRFVPKAPPYDLSRRLGFKGLADQLDMLYHDMEEGIIPGKESSTWFAHVKSIKDQYPKP